MEVMTTTPAHTSIAIVLSFLLLTAICGRLGLTELLAAEPEPDLSPTGPLCLGFADAGGEIIGVAFADSETALVSTAMDRLDLPDACAALELPDDLEIGALIRLSLEDGGCAVGAVDRLPGPQRFVCGAGVDVNRDPARDIELLPGIGPRKAGAIVESRERDGPFESLDDLTRVKGIGDKTVERIRPWADLVH